MKTFVVYIPITAIATVELEAENAEQAFKLARDKASLEDVETWETHKKIVEGNVFHGVINEYEVEEI